MKELSGLEYAFDRYLFTELQKKVNFKKVTTFHFLSFNFCHFTSLCVPETLNISPFTEHTAISCIFVLTHALSYSCKTFSHILSLIILQDPTQMFPPV